MEQEHSMPDIHTCKPLACETRKPNNTISWLGFSFSLFVLLLLIIVIITVISIKTSSDSGIASGSSSGLVMIFVLIGMPLGLVGLILSVVGLIKASSRGGKKWIGTCGIIFIALCILSIFAPIFLRSIMNNEPSTVPIITNIEDTKQLEKGVVFEIQNNQLKCYDNRNKLDTNPYTTRLKYSFEIEDELDVWFKLHNIPKNELIKLNVSNNTNYKYVSHLLNALNSLGRTKYQLIDNLNNTDKETVLQ